MSQRPELKSESKIGHRDRRKLGEILRTVLGSAAPPNLLNDREVIDAMMDGAPAPSIGDLLVNKVVKLALDPAKANQWAVELIFDRVEGKATPNTTSDQEGRSIDERIENVSVAHLNSLAKQFVASNGFLDSACRAEKGTSGPVADPAVEVPGDGPVRPEGA